MKETVEAVRPAADGPGPLLRAENLTVGYRGFSKAGRTRGTGSSGPRDRNVLSGLDLEIKAGEMVCLLGPNGAGKSTLLRTLAGLQPPLHGRLTLEGIDFARLSAEARARGIAIVLTERIEAGNLTAYALTALGRHPHTGWSGRLRDGDRNAVRRGLEDAGAWDLRERLFDELSDGEKQRVMLARALAQEAALLLLDEPTAFLDLARRVETLRTLRGLARRRGRGVLLSTHDLDLAMRAADRLWLLPAGGPVQSGLPEDLALQGAIAAVFDQGDVAFDLAAGQFRIHRHPEKSVRLSGDPLLMLWTARALEREGFGAEEAQGARVEEGSEGARGGERVKASYRVLATRRDGLPRWECAEIASGRSLGIFATLEALSIRLRA